MDKAFKKFLLKLNPEFLTIQHKHNTMKHFNKKSLHEINTVKEDH